MIPIRYDTFDTVHIPSGQYHGDRLQIYAPFTSTRGGQYHTDGLQMYAPFTSTRGAQYHAKTNNDRNMF